MASLSAALADLLRAAGAELPSSLERDLLWKQVVASSWLRFAVGLDAPRPLANEAGLAQAAAEFAACYVTWNAYRRTVLEVQPPSRPPLRFRISSEASPLPVPDFPAAALAIITACNPSGPRLTTRKHTRIERRSDDENRRANAQLQRYLDVLGVTYWPAIHAPDSVVWREEGFAVFGLSLDEAWQAGERFGQRAIYYIEGGQPLLVARRRGRVVTWRGVLTAA